MKIISEKKILILILSLIFIIVVFLFLFNRNNYFLNKTVRLISLRFTQFERLSFIRREDYRIEFHKNNYLIFSFNNRTKIWEEFAKHNYPLDIISSIEECEFVLSRGKISSIKINGKKINLKSYLILNFYRPKTPSKTKGIIFYKDGNWRVLGL